MGKRNTQGKETSQERKEKKDNDITVLFLYLVDELYDEGNTLYCDHIIKLICDQLEINKPEGIPSLVKLK